MNASKVFFVVMAEKEKKGDKEGWRKTLLSGLSSSKKEEKEKVTAVSRNHFLKFFRSWTKLS